MFMNGPVLVVPERRNGEVREISYEIIEAGRELAEELEKELMVVLVGQNANTKAENFQIEGVDKVLTSETPTWQFNSEMYRKIIKDIISSTTPSFVLAPHSSDGLSYAPAIAADLNTPFLSGVETFDIGEDSIEVERRKFSSKIIAKRRFSLERTSIFIIPEGEWDPIKKETNPSIPIEKYNEKLNVQATLEKISVRGGEYYKPSLEEDITSSDILVSIGRGIEEEENLDMIFELADLLGGKVSCSRPLTDYGWLPTFRQVGDSGQTVKPNIYLAIGISGSMHHVKGMKSSDTIIAINNDPTAPIFNIADYGIVGDLFDVIPLLLENLREEN